MFREMRRNKQLMSAEDTVAVLNRRTNGTLACLGDDDYPYAVPLNYVYLDGRIYFHSAKTGHKIDAVTKHAKVSFSVTDEDTIVSESYTSHFRSVIAFGRARIVEGDEYRRAITALVEKYSGDQPETFKQGKINECARAHFIAIDIEHMTGKEALAYVNARNA